MNDMNHEAKLMSLDDLDVTKSSDKPFEFEYIDHTGKATGIFFSVLGGESQTVKSEVARLQNDRRRQHAAREVRSKVGVGAKKIEFDSYEEDVEYGRKIAAVRLVGWRGISNPFTADNALRLCQSNSHVAAAITEQSEAIENFMQG